MNTPPNEVRYFVHKRLLRGVKGFVGSGFNPLAAASGFLAPSPRPRKRTIVRAGPALLRPDLAPPVRRPAPRSQTARPGAISSQEKAAGRSFKFPEFSATVGGVDFSFGNAGPQDCGFARVWDEVLGKCVYGIGQQAGRDDTPIGDPVMGRYGAGEQPGNMVVNRAICRSGMVLGNDGICYNRSQISNKEREWPRGRRPLLTGGDMRAISTAARAGKRLEGATKRLQKIGLMKKPAPRSKAAALPPHQHTISSGG